MSACQTVLPLDQAGPGLELALEQGSYDMGGEDVPVRFCRLYADGEMVAEFPYEPTPEQWSKAQEHFASLCRQHDGAVLVREAKRTFARIRWFYVDLPLAIGEAIRARKRCTEEEP